MLKSKNINLIIGDNDQEYDKLQLTKYCEWHNCKEKGEIVGQGTGDVKEHLDHLRETNTKIYVSGMSAKARGYDENILKEYNAEFAMPNILIELSLEADSFLSF